jgi:hypothetical protein
MWHNAHHYYIYLDDIFMNDLINNNNKFIDNITRIINNYKKMNYKFMSREDIYNSVSKIITKNL